MKFQRMTLVVMCVVFLAAVVCPAAQDKVDSTSSPQVDLKLRLKAGESHEMKTTQTQDINQTVNGQEMKIKQTNEMVMGLDCLSVDANGVMDIQMTYKSMKMAMDSPMGHIDYNSVNPKPADPNKPQEKMMASIFSAMVGCKFQMKVKPTGEAFDLRGSKEMIGKVKEKMSNSPETKGAEEFLDKMFDEKQLKELTGKMMVMFPEGTVAVGDTWYETRSFNFIMPIDVSTTYMLKDRKDGIAYIDAVAKMDIGDSSKPIQMGPKKMSMQLAGTMNSTNQVDEKTGLVRKGNMKMNFSGIMRAESEPNKPSQPVPITMMGNAVVELVK